jgi:hypothetical protein
VRTRRAGTCDAVVELGGQGPLASSPRLKVSPSPSCPLSFCPQHLTVASSCREKATEHHCPGKKRLAGHTVHPRASGNLILKVVCDVCEEGLDSRLSILEAINLGQRLRFGRQGLSMSGARMPHHASCCLPIFHWAALPTVRTHVSSLS